MFKPSKEKEVMEFEITVEQIQEAIETARGKPCMNPSDHPTARILLPGPRPGTLYSFFLAVELFGKNDGVWHGTAAVVLAPFGGIEPQEDVEQKRKLLGICMAVMGRIGIADTEAYETPGAIHFYKPMTPEEEAGLPMFLASDACHDAPIHPWPINGGKSSATIL